MKKIFLLSVLFFSFWVFSQKNSVFSKQIDSISQRKWDSVALDLDSLADPKVSQVKTRYDDIVLQKEEALAPVLIQDIPITPYNLVNIKEPKIWFFYGQNNLIFNQSAFSNWNSGGNNNIGVIGKINYSLSYKRRKHFFDNNLQLGYGFVASTGQSTRKTEDYINLMSNYGYELGHHYYLSTGFQFVSQFTPGFNYATTQSPEFSDRISRFMAPGYLNIGVGISYNPSENFQIIFRPLNGKFTFVTDPLLQKMGRYGLERDEQSVRSELGSMLNVRYRLKIYKDINFVNQVNFFSNYTQHPERVDIAYNGTLNLKFNKFISSTVSLDLMYDHDQLQKLQMKQTLGIGFAYNLGLENQPRADKNKFAPPFIAK